MADSPKRIWFAVFKRSFPKKYWEESNTVTVYVYYRDISTLLDDAREALRKQYGDDAVKDNPVPLQLCDWEAYGISMFGRRFQ